MDVQRRRDTPRHPLLACPFVYCHHCLLASSSGLMLQYLRGDRVIRGGGGAGERVDGMIYTEGV